MNKRLRRHKRFKGIADNLTKLSQVAIQEHHCCPIAGIPKSSRKGQSQRNNSLLFIIVKNLLHCITDPHNVLLTAFTVPAEKIATLEQLTPKHSNVILFTNSSCHWRRIQFIACHQFLKRRRVLLHCFEYSESVTASYCLTLTSALKEQSASALRSTTTTSKCCFMENRWKSGSNLLMVCTDSTRDDYQIALDSPATPYLIMITAF